jgi:Protein of unknown function (DUF4239)
VNGLLTTVPAWLLAVATIVLSCLCSVGIVALVRRYTGRAQRGEHHNEVLGMLLSAVGIFSAIVVALAVFVVWDHLTTARQAEVDEGASLIALYQDAAALPEPARTQVETSIRDYTTSMIQDDFPSLSRGESSDATDRSLTRMSRAVHDRLGSTSAPDLVTSIARSQYQLSLAAAEGMPPMLWALLIGACLLLLLMAAPLFMESARYHAIGSVLLGCALGASLFLILVADHPFAGPLQVEPSDLSSNLHMYSVMDSAR